MLNTVCYENCTYAPTSNPITNNESKQMHIVLNSDVKIRSHQAT